MAVTPVTNENMIVARGTAAIDKAELTTSIAISVHNAYSSASEPKGVKTTMGIDHASAIPPTPAACFQYSYRDMRRRSTSARLPSILSAFHSTAATASTQAT